MSFASTVSSVIDVPATHSSGVNVIWPAWTDAISSSRIRTAGRRPTRCTPRPGWTRTPGRRAVVTMTTATTVPTAAIQRPAGCGDAPETERDPEAGVDERESGHEDRRAEPWDEHERHDQAAEDGADGVRREQAARPLARRGAASSASSADEAGKATPSAIVTGRTTRTDEPTRAMSVSNGSPGVGTCGATRTRTRPASASAAAIDLAGGEEPERIAEPGPEDREEHGPEGDPDEEGGQDGREDVGRVAGPRGEEPRPGHLVAERGQARDEGDGEGEARRGPARGDGRPGGGDRRFGGRRSVGSVAVVAARRIGRARAPRARPRPSSRHRPPAPPTGRAAR